MFLSIFRSWFFFLLPCGFYIFFAFNISPTLYLKSLKRKIYENCICYYLNYWRILNNSNICNTLNVAWFRWTLELSDVHIWIENKKFSCFSSSYYTYSNIPYETFVLVKVIFRYKYSLETFRKKTLKNVRIWIDEFWYHIIIQLSIEKSKLFKYDVKTFNSGNTIQYREYWKFRERNCFVLQLLNVSEYNAVRFSIDCPRV